MSATAFNVGAGGKLTLVQNKHFAGAGSWKTPKDYKLISVTWLHTGAGAYTTVTFSGGNVAANDNVAQQNWDGRRAVAGAALALDVPKNTSISWSGGDIPGLEIYCFK